MLNAFSAATHYLTMKHLLKIILQISLPFVLGFGILWWMYRATDWHEFMQCVTHDMKDRKSVV